jgi:anthranilate synthase component 1
VYGRNTYDDLQVCGLAQPVDLLGLHRSSPQRYPFLLQSTAARPPLGRYDILFACPGETLELDRRGQLRGSRADGESGFLAALDGWWRSESRSRAVPQLPFHGGWFLYLGYELAAEIEPVLVLPADEALPAALAVRCRAAIIHDHVDRQSWFVAEAAADLDLDRVMGDIARTARASEERLARSPARGSKTFEEDAEPFLQAVERAKEHIAAGDVYQANLSRGWITHFREGRDAADLYSALSVANPAPFAGLVRWGDAAIISSSPERLLRLQDGIASTRPIAGTRPRSTDRDDDDRLSSELFDNPKERAEHIMLIDLERNDLGRICEAGTVEVDEMMALESYAHVHHIVSNVSGRLKTGIAPGEAIRAVFPGGTITGCPKVRCMQIISELEGVPRGAYTGSFGYLNRDGSLDLNILIRTMVLRGRTLTLRAGAGIVADSEPVAELAETRAKAEGMLRSLAV